MSQTRPAPGRLTLARKRVLDREFERLLDLDDRQRRRRLKALKRRYPRFTQRLEPLLAALTDSADEVESIIAEMAGSALASLDEPDPDLPAGTRLGPWKLVEVVGNGGMGTVYRARRADGAFEMEAAIKLIRIRHDQRLARRLEVERRLLARLDHPNIARILDGGTTDDGQAYLVMDWVAGSDLNHCAREHRDNPSTCLELFARICEAVHHAHQRRIVHGDIKPANLRLGEDGRIRLLDFGVARLLAEEGDQPESGVRALTPAFSAPELQRGEPASTQSDVWALGALLYWMLTGTTINRHENIGPDLIARQLRGIAPRHRDLAAIIARACADDPDQRYAGASAISRELERYQQLRPVAARPARHSYVFSRFVRRNPVAVGLGSMSIAVLIAGLLGTAWQAHLAGIERDRAELERDRAHIEAARTQRVSEFMIDLFEQADPHRALGTELSARELVHQGSERLDDLTEAPMVQAAMYQVLARVNRSLAEHETAHTMSRRALEVLSDHPAARREDLAEAWTLKGATLSSLGRYAESELAHRRALALTDSNDRPAIARALNNIGLALYSLGRFQQAEVLMRESLHIQQTENLDRAALASAYNNLGLVMAAQGQRGEAEPLYRQALELRRKELGELHPATTYALTNLATLLAQRGDWDEAQSAYAEALASRRKIYGNKHPAVASVLYQMGWLHSQRHDFGTALIYYEEALEIRRAMLGDDHPSVAVMLNALGQIAREQDQTEQARAWLEQALETYRRAYGDSHHDIALVKANLGATHMMQGDFGEAEALLTGALEMSRTELGDHHPHVVDNLELLAELHLARRESQLALARAREAETVLQKIHGENEHPAVSSNRALIARINGENGQ